MCGILCFVNKQLFIKKQIRDWSESSKKSKHKQIEENSKNVDSKSMQKNDDNDNLESQIETKSTIDRTFLFDCLKQRGPDSLNSFVAIANGNDSPTLIEQNNIDNLQSQKNEFLSISASVLHV
jgi:hypothetical protein